MTKRDTQLSTDTCMTNRQTVERGKRKRNPEVSVFQLPDQRGYGRSCGVKVRVQCAHIRVSDKKASIGALCLEGDTEN